MPEHTPQLALFTSAPNDPTQEIPYGYCHCGCGQKTNIAKQTVPKTGAIRGEPYKHLNGHCNKGRSLSFLFWRYVTPGNPDECWEWQGNLVDGYGTITRPTGTVRAHRASYELHFGPIPDGLYVCHDCPNGDNRRCVNPAHLWLGTHNDNMQDMIRKGRNNQAKGERQGSAKLTGVDVVAIRQLDKDRVPRREVAKRYGITVNLISKIVRRALWAHVP